MKFVDKMCAKISDIDAVVGYAIDMYKDNLVFNLRLVGACVAVCGAMAVVGEVIKSKKSKEE